MSDLMNSNDSSAEKREELAQQIQQLVQANETPELNEAPALVEEAAPMSEMEQKARSLGWKSKEERLSEGKNDLHYIEPDEYVRRQPLFERLSQQKRELEETKALAKQAMQHLVEMRKQAYQNDIRNVESQKMKAVEEGDTTRFQHIEAQVRNLRDQEAKDPIIHQPSAPVQANPELTKFAQRNESWYNDSTIENRKMRAAAEAIDTFLYKQAQIDQGLPSNQEPHIDYKIHLAEIENRVKGLPEFSHRFSNNQRNAPSSVGKSTSTPSNTIVSKSEYASKLSADQLQMGKYFERTSKGAYTLEMYAKELAAMGRLKA
jgi:hypothetical protein